MSPQLVAILASIYAAHARIEGMKAENAQRQAHGYSMAYSDQNFGEVADDLDRLSIEARSIQ